MEKIKDSKFKKYVYGDSKTLLGVKLSKKDWLAMWIFLGAIALVTLIGAYDSLKPTWCQLKSFESHIIDSTLKWTPSGENKCVVDLAKLGFNQKGENEAKNKFENVIDSIKVRVILQTDTLGNPKMYHISVVNVIQCFMLLVGVLMIISRTNVKKIGNNEIFKSGMIALVTVFGNYWMDDSIFAVHTPMMKATL